jgi:hypothetical protein
VASRAPRTADPWGSRRRRGGPRIPPLLGPRPGRQDEFFRRFILAELLSPPPSLRGIMPPPSPLPTPESSGPPEAEEDEEGGGGA